jgi:arylsulfatase A-like enzyme
LLARRLIETGVPFVEVGMPDWDNHSGCRFHEENLPPLDAALSALITDLSARGLLDSTLIVLMGEFGRGGTGKVDRGIGENRGHWPRAWSTALFGGGIQGGAVIGRTDPIAAVVEDRPVSIADFFATICSILGIDYLKENNSPGGRPVPIVVDAQRVRPTVIREIL